MQPATFVDTVWPVLVEVAPRVARIAVLIGVGVFLANVAVGFGAVEAVAAFSKYLTRPANLPDEVGTAIVTTAASTTAGYGMLADFRESGRLDDVETLIAVTMNTFFGFVQHIFTFYAPVLIPILGVETGLLYVGSRAAIAAAITVVGVAAGAVLLPRASASGDAGDVTTDGPAAGDDTDRPESAPDGGTRDAGSDDPESPPEVLRTAAGKTWPKLKRIVPRLAVVYVFVTILLERWDSISRGIESLTGVLGLKTRFLTTW